MLIDKMNKEIEKLKQEMRMVRAVLALVVMYLTIKFIVRGF